MTSEGAPRRTQSSVDDDAHAVAVLCCKHTQQAAQKCIKHWDTMDGLYSDQEHEDLPDDEAAFDEAPFAIATAPTVDTLDDGSPFRPGPDVSFTDQPDRSRSIDIDRVQRSQRESTPTRRGSKSLPKPEHLRASSVPAMRSSSAQHSSSDSVSRARSKSSSSRSIQTPLPPRPASGSPVKKRRKSTRTRDFQHPEDVMTVTARTIDLETRTAFEPIRPVSIEEWQSIADHAGEVRKTNMQKKLSPSLQHLELLHKMHSIKSIRQLDFSPSVGLESDIFVPWDEDLQGESGKRRRRSKSKRDGRYRSIDPFKAVAAALPPHPPELSNRKYRLPMRSDVGFPNASEQEIMKKQQEISRETEWEEASPRLVVLVTSDDIGTAIHDDPASAILLQHEEWNGGGLEGMPFAGKELMMAKERNKRLLKPPTEGEKDDFHEWKPELTNMLAPPLEASYSSTLGWRPRPFNDLPPGMLHCLACPLNVQFDIGNIEPMTGSLALYCLPNDPSRKGVFGKMSEEFYFPVGMWKGNVSLEAARTLKGSFDTDMIEAWHGRKHKGLFPYDPLAVPWSHASLYLVLQVYKVPHWNATGAYIEPKGQKIGSLKKGKGISSRLKGSMSKKGKSEFDGKSRFDDTEDDIDIVITQARASATFDTFRTQFLMPLCFGVIPLFQQHVVDVMAADVDKGIRTLVTSDLMWPHGATKDMNLYAYPSAAVSQEDFVMHVINVAMEESGRGSISNRSQSPNLSTGDLSILSEGTSEGASDAISTESPASVPNAGASSSSFPSRGDISMPSKKSFLKRSSNKVQSGIKRRVPGNISRFEKIAGRATIFTSSVGNDFTQSMLNTPIELLDFGSERGVQALPRLLVDVSGDCAIMMNPKSLKASPISSVQGFETGKRRSDLVRLPVSASPSGYADASEVRQLMYLPPRAEKQYDIDSPNSFRSCLNLLYMYPRLLRFAQDTNTKSQGKRAKTLSYSVRIQLVRNSGNHEKSSGKTETSQDILESFHNPTPWAGPQMLQAIYTKVNDASNSKHVERDLHNGGIPLRDEVKMRLPMVLDGSYFLQCTLFSVKFDDKEMGDEAFPFQSGAGIMSIDALAESTIPLSSTSNREPRSGVRVTTVIPNGCHRIRLGDYQLLLETRLVSSIHVCDPTLATILRDFPYVKDYNETRHQDKFKELSLVPSRSVVGKAEPADLDESVPFHQMFASSPESTILGYFPLLIYMHLCNLVNTSTSALGFSPLLVENLAADQGAAGSDSSWKFAMENMNSLLEVFRKVKIRLGSRTDSREARKRADLFVKKFLDSFDELSLLREPNGNRDTGKVLELDGTSSERSRSSASFAGSHKSRTPRNYHDDDGDSDDSEDEDNVSLVAVRRRNDKGTVKSSLTFNASGTPFSRIAFGASKTDRMRVEAELFYQSNQFTHLLDDDETIITNLHSLATPRPDINADAAQNEADPLRGYILPTTTSEDSMISHSSTNHGKGELIGEDATQGQGPSESAFAKRVRIAAQTMIAPCITPSLSAVLSGAGNSPKEEASQKERRKAKMPASMKSRAEKMRQAEEPQTSEIVFIFPGSDVDDESASSDEIVHGEATSDKPILRNVADVKTLVFTLEGLDSGYAADKHDVPFVYEVTMALWLKSFVTQVETSGSNGAFDESLASRTNSPVINHANLFRTLCEDSSVSASAPFYMFHSHMDILLPLCMKSFLLRCNEALSDCPQSARVVLDHGHMQLLISFVEMLTHAVIGEALTGPDDDADLALLKALSSSQLLLDFLVGLASILHPQYFATLVEKHLRILRECEITHQDVSFVWSKENLRRARCSRQLRLRTVERLACMPNFVALNYPLKFGDNIRNQFQQSTDWDAQSVAYDTEGQPAASICPYPDGRDRVPESAWLANLLAGESLSIASLSCEAVVAEAIAHVETSSLDKRGSPSKGSTSSTSERPGASLKRDDLLMFQSLSIHAVSCVYELMLRRHAMDARFQKDQARSRIAALFAPVILEKSLRSTRWLARMEATHKVRSIWLLCFIYIMQEAPESQLRGIVRSYCSSPGFLVHRFIRMLRLSSATFQSFIEQSQHSSSASVLSEGLAPWLLQECFNTICATANMLVDEGAVSISASPKEEKKMTQGLLDLLLHVLTAPQSAVTYLRTVGGALHTLNKLGVENFLEAGGTNIQHWLRIILTLMNSISLSVRSMAVDFIVSLLGAAFNVKGNIDEIGIMMATVLPEVVAREIALYSVSGLIMSIDDVETAVWPLRRALADIEESNPLDDDRIDPFLSPLLSTLCRACQAIIDGVLIEIRLTGDECNIVGIKVQLENRESYIFDADEESLYEAASFFLPESAPLQKLRWLFTLARLHEAKGQWIEAGEALILCARTSSDAMPHLKSVWRPSRFVLWYDSRRSLWLSTVGKDMGRPDRGHEQVMHFADVFLEPPSLVEEVLTKSPGSRLPQPTVQGMCTILKYASKQAVLDYTKEFGMEELASTRLESVLQELLLVTNTQNAKSFGSGRNISLAVRKRAVDELASLRRASAVLNGELSKLAEYAMADSDRSSTRNKSPKSDFLRRQYYVRVILTGKKPQRFLESTSIPTFSEWNNPCICRVPRGVVESVVASGARDPKRIEDQICKEYGGALRNSLLTDPDEHISLMFRTGAQVEDTADGLDISTTFLDVSMVHMDLKMATSGGKSDNDSASRQSRHFFYRKFGSTVSEPAPPKELAAGKMRPELLPESAASFTELTVAHPFPCALSRQRTLLTSEILAENPNEMQQMKDG